MLVALRDRLRAARLRVLVVGEAKRGKSTLVNALLESRDPAGGRHAAYCGRDHRDARG